MTEETIEKIIDSLNKPEPNDFLFLRSITDKVSFGRVWLNYPEGKSCNENSYSMFFIKDLRKYIGAVLDMGEQDIHVFVKPQHRRKGHLVNALRLVILPFLFSTGRKEQRITFKTEGAKHYAQKVGFKIQSEDSGIMLPADLPRVNAPLSLIPAHPSKKQVERIKQRIRKAAAILRIARDEVESLFGDDNAFDIEALASEVAGLAFIIHDNWQDQERLPSLGGSGNQTVPRLHY